MAKSVPLVSERKSCFSQLGTPFECHNQPSSQRLVLVDQVYTDKNPETVGEEN